MLQRFFQALTVAAPRVVQWLESDYMRTDIAMPRAHPKNCGLVSPVQRPPCVMLNWPRHPPGHGPGRQTRMPLRRPLLPHPHAAEAFRMFPSDLIRPRDLQRLWIPQRSAERKQVRLLVARDAAMSWYPLESHASAAGS